MNLLLAQVKPYLYGALVIGLVVFFLWINGLVRSKEALEAKVSTLDAQVKSTTAILTKERKSATEANDRAKQTQLEKQVIENEAKANAECIRNRTCGVRVELKYQTCPVSSANASGSGYDELQEQNRRNFELWINDLKESIRLDNLYIVKLQEDVRVRSDSKYCQPK